MTSPLEANSSFELEDPLEEDKDSPVPGITHRYPDRVLMVTTHVCTMYCRFCTRTLLTRSVVCVRYTRVEPVMNG